MSIQVPEELNLRLQLGNAAFADGYAEEVCAILRKLADRYETYGLEDALLSDTNGNNCGRARVTWVEV